MPTQAASVGFTARAVGLGDRHTTPFGALGAESAVAHAFTGLETQAVDTGEAGAILASAESTAFGRDAIALVADPPADAIAGALASGQADIAAAGERGTSVFSVLFAFDSRAGVRAAHFER